MRRTEAEAMTAWIQDIGLPSGAVCLNIGSSTHHFRTVARPHIHQLLFGPLEKHGLKVVHCDLKADDGVDEVGDVLDPAYRHKLRSHNAELMICSNLLEHLTDPADFARSCAELVRPGGYALFTVPRKYPYHADPIDTMFRPSPRELAALLPDWQQVRADEIDCGSYLDDLRSGKATRQKLLRNLARFLVPFYRPVGWWHNAQRLSFLFRQYRVTMLLLRRPMPQPS